MSPLPVEAMALLEDAIPGLWDPFINRLRVQWEPAETKPLLLEQARESNRDILTLLLALLRNEPAARQSLIRNCLRRVRREDFSITDLHIEFTSVREVIAQNLAAQPQAQVASILVWVSAQLNDIFHDVLEQTSAVYETVAESGGRAFCQVGNDGLIEYANGKMLDLLGEDDAEGKDASQFFGTDQALIAKVIAGDYGRGPMIREVRLRRSDGSKVQVSAELAPLTSGASQNGAYLVLTVLSDITEAELSIFARSKLGIFKSNANGEITFVNRKGMDIAGIDSFDGLTLFELFPDPTNRAIVIDQMDRRRSGLSDEYTVEATRINDGVRVPVSVSSTGMYDNKGEFIGAVAVIRDIRLEQAIGRFHNHIENARDEITLFDAISAETNSIVPLDVFSVSIYSNDLLHTRSIYTHHADGPPIDWERRWWVQPDWLIEWTRQNEIQPVGDLQEFLSQPGMNYMREDRTVRDFIERGIRAFVRYPIFRGNLPIASVYLSSKKPNAFANSAEALSALPMESAIYAALHMREQREQNFRLRLLKDISNCREIDEVADTIVTSLAQHSEWQNVCLFRVNAQAKSFELLAQAAGKVDGYELDKSYEQPIGKGLLGHAYLSGQAVNLRDTEADTEAALRYVAGHPSTRSEYCTPVALGGKIRWLLVINDSRKYAFADEELTAVEEIVHELRAYLDEQLLGRYLSFEILAAASDAIVVTDTEGLVVHSNAAADELLGGENPRAKGKYFMNFFTDRQLGQSVLESIPPRMPVDLVGSGGKTIKAMLAGRQLPEEFGRMVFFIQDQATVERLQQLEAMRDVFHEIASQVRTPLSLLSSWVRRIDPNKISEFSVKAGRQLRKIDLTYERLALYGQNAGALPHNPMLLNLSEIVEASRAELPASDQSRILIQNSGVDSDIRADPAHCTLILQTVLTFTLRYLSVDERIYVNLEASESDVRVRIGAIAPDMPLTEWGDDTNETLTRRTQMALALSEPMLKGLMERNHGAFSHQRLDRGQAEFLLVFPLSNEEEDAKSRNVSYAG